jgi:hypothetical protein
MINPNWWKRVATKYEETGSVDEIVSYNGAAQLLIEFLSKKNKMFKVYNMGAGVKRITTDTQICPCCKKSL